MDDMKRIMQIRFQLRAGDVYDRLAKRLGTLYPPILLEPNEPLLVTPIELIISAQNALASVPDAIGIDGMVRRMFLDVLEDWLTGMALFAMSTDSDGQMWMLRSALRAANRATDVIERIEDIMMNDQE